jgi:hypothetical protein
LRIKTLREHFEKSGLDPQTRFADATEAISIRSSFAALWQLYLASLFDNRVFGRVTRTAAFASSWH